MDLSVCIVTYNHEKFIRDCLDGVLKQIFIYDYEIIICDDNSSDDTLRICHEYQRRYPNLIKVISNHQNIYAIGALGSRGFSLAPLLGELIASQISQSPNPISTGIALSIDPMRFID